MSGPTVMGLADTAMYAVCLAAAGPSALGTRFLELANAGEVAPCALSLATYAVRQAN